MSSTPLLLALDLGTTNCKAAVFDLAGRDVARAYEAYPTHLRHGGAYEQRPRDWIAAATNVIRDVSSSLKARVHTLVGLSVTAWGPGLVLVSPTGEVLNDYSPTWQDFRSDEYGRRLIRRCGPAWIGGGMPLSGFPAKLAWALDQWPSSASARMALGVKDYLVYWLTGRYVTEPSSGPFGPVWREEVFEAVGWDLDRLPPVRSSLEVGGLLNRGRAVELTLPPGLPVVMGLNDGASATLGAGSCRVGDTVVSLGTNGVLRVVVASEPDPQRCLDRSMFRYPFVTSRWITGGFALSGGDSLRWLVHALGAAGEKGGADYETALEDAASVSPGCDGVVFLPYLIGRGAPLANPRASGSYTGLRSMHGRGHLVRAVLEGVACALQDVRLAVDEVATDAGDVVLSGGGGKASLWQEVIAGVFGRPVRAPGGDSALGAAIVAATALGYHESIERAVESMVPAVERVEPPDDRSAYLTCYSRFQDLQRRIYGDEMSSPSYA